MPSVPTWPIVAAFVRTRPRPLGSCSRSAARALTPIPAKSSTCTQRAVRVRLLVRGCVALCQLGCRTALRCVNLAVRTRSYVAALGSVNFAVRTRPLMRSGLGLCQLGSFTAAFSCAHFAVRKRPLVRSRLGRPWLPRVRSTGPIGRKSTWPSKATLAEVFWLMRLKSTWPSEAVLAQVNWANWAQINLAV